MPEVRNIGTQHVDERCPKCGQGYMRPTGIVQDTNPPLFEHSCNQCGNVSFYTVRYPYIVGS
jgi:ribosomal protein S27AE